MKIKKKQLREFVRGVIKEAAKQGLTQKVYKKSFNNMIALISTAGGNKNTPPFTNKAAKAGKSGPPE